MGTGKIYLREEDGLVPMSEEPYDAEDILQRLLADYPDLLAGDQIRPSSPRRWLLITQEASIPDTEGGAGRWSLDHLFVDQDAIPTLVEVKRSSDTRLRREVVGQMLDYAANIAAYWPSGEVRSIFEARCAADGLDADDEAQSFIAGPDDVAGGEDGDVALDDFWQRVSDNLAARRLRLVFVADVIPRELQRIIEFLNEGLATSDVLGVEVKQYVGEGRQTLVPRVIGWTAAAEDVKRSPSSKRYSWTDESFLEAVTERASPANLRLVRDALDWAANPGHAHRYGGGKGGPLYIEAPDATGEPVSILDFYADGMVEVHYRALRDRPPFDDVEVRLEMSERLSGIPGVDLKRDAAINATWPTISPALASSEEGRRIIVEVLDWAADLLAKPGDG